MLRSQDSDSEARIQSARRAMPQTPIRPYADTPIPIRDPFLLQPGNQNWLLKFNLFAIAARSAAIDNDKLALQEKRKQSVMPDAFCVVDAFTSLGEKDAHRPFIEMPRGRNYGKVRVFGKRYERLAPEGWRSMILISNGSGRGLLRNKLSKGLPS